MTAWWDGNITVFDLESDDKDPQEARIITGCVAMVRPGQKTQSATWMAQPERDIPAETTEIHGITTEQAQRDGMPREEAITLIASWVSAGTASSADARWGAVPLVGHNLRYDLTLLDREMRRTGVGRLSTTYEGEPGRVTVLLNKGGRLEPFGAFYCIDTMILDMAVDTFRPGPRGPGGEKLGGRNKLETTAEFYGVPIRGDAHTAEADALASGRIAWAIAKRCGMARGIGANGSYDKQRVYDLLNLYSDRKDGGNSVGRAMSGVATLGLPQLHGWLRRKAAEQAAGFKQHVLANLAEYTEKGVNPDDIRGEWPMIPLTREPAESISTDLV